MARSGFGASAPLHEFDAALAAHLREALVTVLREELDQRREDAEQAAAEVSWTVRREPDGMWLGAAFNGGEMGIGGNWHQDRAGLKVYVRQLAYTIAGRAQEFTS